MSEPTTEKIRSKLYRCKECGYENEQSTNHFGEVYSWGSHNTCPSCPPYKRPNTWVCCEEPPAGMGKPEPRKMVKVVIKNTTKRKKRHA